MPPFIILRKLPVSGPRGFFQVLVDCNLATTYHPSKCQLPAFFGAEKRLPEVRDGSVYLGHKTGSGALGVWGSKLELPSTGPTIYLNLSPIPPLVSEF